MDRFSIIQKQLFDQNVVDETNTCGQDQCQCNEHRVNEKPLLKKVDVPLLLIVVIIAFLSAFVFADKTQVGNANVLLIKRVSTISCISGINNMKSSAGRKSPENKNSENNCSHQQGSLCETYSKRKSLKTHNC